MSLLIKNWSEADWKELLKWAKIGANNAMIGEFSEVEELPPHGRLIDADEMVASVKRQTEIMREIAKEVDKLKPIANSKELDDVDIVAIAETVEKGVLQEIANAPTILEAEVEEQ